MGAVHYSLDPRLARLLAETLRLEVFVETGTGNGDTVAGVRQLFSEVHTIESDAPMHAAADRRFLGDAGVHVRLGDSASVLPSIVPGLATRRVLYWLDAHATGLELAPGRECPLVGELTAISKLNEGSVVLIDDARLFLAPPPPPRRPDGWPDLTTVLAALARLSDDHETMVVDDVIVFFPSSARRPLREFAHIHGFDWLHAADKARAYDALRGEAKEKDALIQHLDLECRRRDEQLFAVRAKRAALEKALEARGREDWHRGRQRWRVRFAPKLGVLEQYPPRVIEVPDRYLRIKAPDPAPLISLVTPSFEQGAFLERTLRSVLDQGYPRLEYIVQDGGSRDATPTILECYRPQLARVASKTDRGQAHALNLGFADATGEILGYLNSDDVLLPGALATVATAFVEHPEVDVVYGHRVLIDEEDREIGRWVLPPHDDDVLSWADYVPQETLFWRRGIWERVGARMDESFRFALDWDLLLRFRGAGARFLRLPRFLGCFRVHAGQKTSAEMNGAGLAEMERLRARCHGRVVTQAEAFRHVRPYLVRHVALHKLYRLGLVRY